MRFFVANQEAIVTKVVLQTAKEFVDSVEAVVTHDLPLQGYRLDSVWPNRSVQAKRLPVLIKKCCKILSRCGVAKECLHVRLLCTLLGCDLGHNKAQQAVE